MPTNAEASDPKRKEIPTASRLLAELEQRYPEAQRPARVVRRLEGEAVKMFEQNVDRYAAWLDPEEAKTIAGRVARGEWPVAYAHAYMTRQLLSRAVSLL